MTTSHNRRSGARRAHDVACGVIAAIGDPPVSTTFDGCIRVKDNGSGSFGNLGPFSGIQVVGCLAHDIDICIDGDDNGRIRLTQTGCSPTYTWGCPGACP